MSKAFKLFFMILSSVTIFFLIYPILKTIFSYGSDSLTLLFNDREVIKSILLTFKISLYSTLTMSIIGIPLAYLIARSNFIGKSVIEALIDIPTMIPHTAAGIAILIAYNTGFLGSILNKIGFQLIDSEVGIMFAMMFLSSTYLINGAKEGFKKIDPRYELVARSLGVPWYSAFFRITIPCARRDIINGMLLMWARGLGEFGAVVIIAYHPMVAPVLIFDRFNNFGLKFSAPVAVAMIILSLSLFILIRFLNNRKHPFSS